MLDTDTKRRIDTTRYGWAKLMRSGLGDAFEYLFSVFGPQGDAG